MKHIITKNDKFWRLIPILFFGGVCVFLQYQSLYFESFLIDILKLVFGFIVILIFVWVVIKDQKDLKTSKNKFSFLPSILGIILISFSIILYIYQYKKDNSPTLIFATYDGGYNGISIDLKKDGNVIIKNGSGFGVEVFRSKYSNKNGQIILKKKLEFLSQYLRIINNEFIVQTDNNGYELEDKFSFNIFENNIPKINFKFPVVVDTFSFISSDYKPDFMSTANYKIIYIGKENDTLLVDYALPWKLHNDSTKRIRYIKKGDFFNFENVAIAIVVDTNQIIINADKKPQKCYPVILKNINSYTIYIAYELFIPIIMEAKDSNNTWKPIEMSFMYGCRFGIEDVILPPGEIALSSAIIYHGNYKTDLRLKMGLNYSNIFKGNINYSMFKKEYDN